MENKKGQPVPCLDCPRRAANLSDRQKTTPIQAAGDALFYFSQNDLSLTFIALSKHMDGMVSRKISDAAVKGQFPELTQAVADCRAAKWVTTGEKKKLFGIIPVAADEQPFCPAYEQTFAAPDAVRLAEADQLIKYFKTEEAEG